MGDEEVSETAAQLRFATFRLSRRLRSERAVADLSDTQLAVVNYLTVNGPSSPAALAERERVTRPSMNRTLNHLESAGYIVRLEHLDDRRRVRIEVTDLGRAATAATKAARNAWLESKLSGLSEQELAEIARVSAILLVFVED